MATEGLNAEAVASFHEHLKGSKRIMALVGAGLSAASGLPTFRGAGGIWRNRDATILATPKAFADNPGLVWQFYSYRRHMAFSAKPNPAHYALAALSQMNPRFITLTQNVDDLHQRAGHPPERLYSLHGSLVDVRCTSFCDYKDENRTDPIVPALTIPREGIQPQPSSTDHSGAAAADSLVQAMGFQEGKELDISNPETPLPQLEKAQLPLCPKCKDGLLRPGVVWFGESLPTKVLAEVDAYCDFKKKIDLILVIGTSAQVSPACNYVEVAKRHGARLAIIDADEDNVLGRYMREKDWFFHGDAATIVPELLRPVIGDIGQIMETQFPAIELA